MKVTSLLKQEADIKHKTLQFLSDYYNMNTLTMYLFMYISSIAFFMFMIILALAVFILFLNLKALLLGSLLME